MLSGIDASEIGTVLSVMQKNLMASTGPHHAFKRIANSFHLAPELKYNQDNYFFLAISLANNLGIKTLNIKPEDYFSWDGYFISTQTDIASILHEIAHWQITPYERRKIPDFGLGSGPDTGMKGDSDRFRCVGVDDQIEEENMASLLGILWEVQLGIPAVISFWEQNWLELYYRQSTADHFIRIFNKLQKIGLVNFWGVPILNCNSSLSCGYS